MFSGQINESQKRKRVALICNGRGAKLSQTLLHEIGHALNFADISDQTSVMCYIPGEGNRCLDMTDVSSATSLVPATQASTAFDSGSSLIFSLGAANDDTQPSTSILLAASGH